MCSSRIASILSFCDEVEMKGIEVSIESSRGELGSILKGSFGIGCDFLYATRSSMLNVVSCINPL
jgi:hypothetical protein